jgi:hypothetical protein
VIRGDALQELRIAVFGHEAWAGRRVGFEKGLVFSQASKATLNSVLNLRTYSAAHFSLPSFLAWIHVLNVETSRRGCWPPRIRSSSASLTAEARPYSSDWCPSGCLSA